MLEEAPDEFDDDEAPVTPKKSITVIPRRRKTPELILNNEEVDDVVIKIEAGSAPLKMVQLEPARDDVDAGARLVQLTQDGEEQASYQESINEARERLRTGTWILSNIQGQDVEKLKFAELLKLIRGDCADGTCSTTLELVFRRSHTQGNGVVIFKNFTQNLTLDSESEEEEDTDSDDEGFEVTHLEKGKLNDEIPSTPKVTRSSSFGDNSGSYLFQVLASPLLPDSSQVSPPTSSSKNESARKNKISATNGALAAEASFFEPPPLHPCRNSSQDDKSTPAQEDGAHIIKKLERRLSKFELRLRASDASRDAAVADYNYEHRTRLSLEAQLNELKLRSTAELDAARLSAIQAQTALEEERRRADLAIREQSEQLAKANATASQLDSARRDLVQNIAKWRKAEARATSAETAVKALRKEASDYQQMLLDAVRESHNPVNTTSSTSSKGGNTSSPFASIFSCVLNSSSSNNKSILRNNSNLSECIQEIKEDSDGGDILSTTDISPITPQNQNDAPSSPPSTSPNSITTPNRTSTKRSTSLFHRTPSSSSTKLKKSQRELDLERLCNRLSLANADRDEEIDTLRAVLAEEHILTQRAFGVSRTSRRSRTVAPRASAPLVSACTTTKKVATMD